MAKHMKPRRSLLVLAAFVCAVPAHARAQNGRPLPAVGSYGVSFSLPQGGGAGFGIRRMLSGSRSAGLDVQLGVSWRKLDDAQGEERSRTSFALSLNPDLRLYRRMSGPVVPFVEIDGRVGYRNAHNEAWVVDGGGGVGLGVEWLPLPAMSISGSTGLAWTVGHQRSGGSSENSVTFGVFRSELSLNLYF